MQIVSYRQTMAGAKQIVPDQPEQINPAYLKGRDKLIAISIEYQRRQDERRAAKEALEERIREQVARDKAKWQALAPVPSIPPLRKHDELISMVAFWHGIPMDEIYRDVRSREAVAARHDAMVAVFLNCTLEGGPPSLPALGRIFNRDHTTCLFALRKHGLRSSHYASRAAK